MGIPSERLFELDESAPESRLTPDISDSVLLICPKCGEKQPKGHVYCLECGTKLSSSIQQSITAGIEQKDITQCILCSEDGYDGIPSSFKCPKCGRRVCENHTNVEESICDACFLGDYLKRSQNVKAQDKKDKQGRLCPSCGARISRSSKICDFCYTKINVDSE